MKLSEGGEMKKCWITQCWKRSMYKQKRVLTNHELYFCAQKDICILYLSIIFMASFSEGFLALKNKECLQCSAKQPGSISHECWITLGVPRCVLRMRVLRFYDDSNMVKRYSVKPIADSFHRHGSSVLLNTIYKRKLQQVSLWFSTLQLPALKSAHVPWISFVEVDVAISFCFFHRILSTESHKGALMRLV